jgi:hypothetical protein
MTSDRAVKGRKPRWRLSPREKYEVWISVHTGQAM